MVPTPAAKLVVVDHSVGCALLFRACETSTGAHTAVLRSHEKSTLAVPWVKRRGGLRRAV